ncbi:NLI interacting factor-like phosphatase family protein, putative [Ichthyophthirius multifiliis]|uniref:NLI interacting factor-like phosphatase family protein, putative n=1 Tax=Ichthyophthirius multifiliis TaxID=5932 RepID=G0QVH2_ICHMU|nr:NLI interacting factor-like phosphatase family protein, putative [Ichthyophthirius multifiliis]EGR30782.1 NLI interacting factor-like phosphatase family protein, putative [Ichthyophthirius multifiliis]|eukprot:XP_004032369.1 NLI interacting factor-like phosphatase family protein, putative [Ichthyophthirius multifiliis]
MIKKNGIPILEWVEDKQDQELEYLICYLNEANKYDDVRIFNRNKLRLNEFAKLKYEEII